MRFEIVYDFKRNKWFHYGSGGGDEFCREKQFIPERDCACIVECKRRLNNV